MFVRNHGYRWVLTDVYGAMPVVEGPNGNFANPIGKAFKRVDNGEGDYLPYFLSVILANER